ncbi:MAG TPA: glycosyltransferase family 4 protein [Terriglobales bacterium]|nr:glycosyltransferase family 4 protein [Terriglobales bacterium]
MPEKLSIILAHNYYGDRGGEDIVFERETELLRSRGHRVAAFTCSSRAPSPWKQLTVAAAGAGLYNLKAAHQFRQLLERFRPDLVHVHNTFPLLSPSILSVCRRLGVPVVATLHNYRLLCPAATLYRKGRICQDCRRSSGHWQAVARGCYRDSRFLSAATCFIINVHDRLRTWQRSVRVFIVPSRFTRTQFLAAGWPSRQICTKPHFVLQDPGPGLGQGRFCLFVGRLAPEKGVQTLLRAWKETRCPWSLKIVGDGPLAKQVATAAHGDPRIQWLGAQSSRRVMDLLGCAEALIVPSECLETFGLVVIEAFARAVPVVASGLGALSELVRDGETGVVVPPGDSSALSGAIESLAYGRNRDAMGRRARLEFERRYSAEQNYTLLQEVYQRALGAISPGEDSEPRLVAGLEEI